MTGLFRNLQSASVIALASGVAMCTGCATAPMSLPNQPAPAAIVEMHFHSFEPDTVTIKAGQAVLWRNTTAIIYHTVTDDPKLATTPADAVLPAGAEPWNSDDISSGTSYERVFSVPGTYHYFCIPHESHGMLGTVIVQPAAP